MDVGPIRHPPKFSTVQGMYFVDFYDQEIKKEEEQGEQDEQEKIVLTRHRS